MAKATPRKRHQTSAVTVRARAIYNALKYGLLPSRLYEDERHYDCSYWAHLWMNVRYAWRWATFTETWDDRAFEWSNGGGNR